MANFTAADVKRLREQTAAGMLDCKNALEEADGDFDAAVEILRLKGAKDVGKRASPDRRPTAWSPPSSTAPRPGCSSSSTARPTSWPRPTCSRHVAAEIAQRRAGAPAGRPAGPARPGGPPGRHGPAAHRRGQRLAQGEAGARPVRPARGRLRRHLPAQVRPGPAADRGRAGPAGPAVRGGGQGRGAPGGRDAPAVRDPRRGARRRGRARSAASWSRSPGTRASRSRPSPKIVEGRLNAFFKDVVLTEQPFVRDPKKTIKQMLGEQGVTVRGVRPVPGRPGRMSERATSDAGEGGRPVDGGTATAGAAVRENVPAGRRRADAESAGGAGAPPLEPGGGQAVR